MNAALPQGTLAGTHQRSSSHTGDEGANNNIGISWSRDDTAGALLGLDPDDSNQQNSTRDSLSLGLNPGDDQNQPSLSLGLNPGDAPIQPPGIPPRNSFDDDDDDEFEDLLLCPINQQPPVKGVRFTIPDSNGFVSPQVFEYSALVKYILHFQGSDRHTILQ
jgi:hypothetical protein